MGELKWKSPVPFMGTAEDEREFLGRLIRWLAEQERVAEYDLEEILAFGGLGVAHRIEGFEGLLAAGYTPGDEATIITGPAAPGKYVVTSLHMGTQETTDPAEIYLVKAGAYNLLAQLDPTGVADKDIIGGSVGAGYITLDAADESIVLKTTGSATGKYGWAGSYVNVD